jgi:hypothetical protein
MQENRQRSLFPPVSATALSKDRQAMHLSYYLSYRIFSACRKTNKEVFFRRFLLIFAEADQKVTIFL